MNSRTIDHYRSEFRHPNQLVFLSGCLFVAFAWIAPTSVIGQSSKKQSRLLPVPTKSDIRTTLKTIEGLYADQYLNRAPQARQKFAKTLLVVGEEDKHPTVKYVLFSESLRISRELGDYQNAWQAIDKISQHFEVDELKIRVDLLKDIGKKNRDPEAAYQLAFMVQPSIDLLVVQDRFASAMKLTQSIESIAKRSGNKPLAREWANSEKNLQMLAKRYAELQPYRATLKTNPNDPGANSKLGWYYFFDKKNSEKGLPLLAKSHHSQLATLAKRELQDRSPEATVKNKLATADDWWELAKELNDPTAQDRLKNHAILLYSRMTNQLAGIDKVRVQKRINSQGPIQDEFFSSAWEFRWRTQDDWIVRFRKDGKVSYTNKTTLLSDTVSWQMTANGILVRFENFERYYIFKPGLGDQRDLVGEKYRYDRGPNELMERMTGVRVDK